MNGSPIRVYAFDAYGTLFDVHAAIARSEFPFPALRGDVPYIITATLTSRGGRLWPTREGSASASSSATRRSSCSIT